MSQYTMRNVIQELSNQVDLENDRRWIDAGNGIAALPVMLNLTDGSWVMFVKASANSAMPTHYHTKPLFVFTVYGHWHYPEHEWEARQGHFLYEVPGELHTPTFIEDTLLYSVVTGPIVYPGNDGEADKVTDVYSHYHTVKEHYQQIGLGEEDLKNIIR